LAVYDCRDLKQPQEILDAVAGLVDDSDQSLPFQILVVHGNRDAHIGPVRMLEEVVGAPDVVNIKTGSLKGLEDFGGP
jgi:hypothetical protein